MTLVGMLSNYSSLSTVRVCEWQRITYAHALEQVLGLLVDVERARLAVLSKVEGRDLGDVLVLSLTLLFLELERDTTDRTTLDTLHPASC